MALAALITLHQPDGRPIYVNPEEIIIVAPPGIMHGNAKVLLHDTWISVREYPEDVKRLRDGE